MGFCPWRFDSSLRHFYFHKIKIRLSWGYPLGDIIWEIKYLLKKMRDLTGKNILITGASSGLGKATALKLASLGARIIAIDRNQAKVKKLEEEFSNNGYELISHICDISEREEVISTRNKITSSGLKLDVLVNSAGVWTDNELETRNPDKRKGAFLVNSYMVLANGL